MVGSAEVHSRMMRREFKRTDARIRLKEITLCSRDEMGTDRLKRLTQYPQAQTCLGAGLSSDSCTTSRSRIRHWLVGLLRGLWQGGRFCGSVVRKRGVRGRRCNRSHLDVRIVGVISFFCYRNAGRTYVNSSLMGMVEAIA